MFNDCENDIVKYIVELASQQEVHHAYKLLLVNTNYNHFLRHKFNTCRDFITKIHSCSQLDSIDEFIRQVLLCNIKASKEVLDLFNAHCLMQLNSTQNITISNKIYKLYETTFFHTYYSKLKNTNSNLNSLSYRHTSLIDQVPLYQSLHNSNILHINTFIFLRVIFFKIYNTTCNSTTVKIYGEYAFWKNYQLLQMGMVSYKTIYDYFMYQRQFGIAAINYHFINMVEWEVELIQAMQNMCAQIQIAGALQNIHINTSANIQCILLLFLESYKKLRTLVIDEQYTNIDTFRKVYNKVIYYYTMSNHLYNNNHNVQHEDYIIKHVLLN